MGNDKLISSGGQGDPSDDFNALKLDYQIKLEELKSKLQDIETQLREKDEVVETQERQMQLYEKKLKDLQIKRENAINEINNLKSLSASGSQFSTAQKVAKREPEVSGSPTKKLGKNSYEKPPVRDVKQFGIQSMVFLEGKDKGHSEVQSSFDFSNGMPKGVSTTNLGVGQGQDINYIFVINPEKLEVFTKDVATELKSAYCEFLDYATSGKQDGMLAVEKQLNRSLQLVRDFENYVDDKMEHLNLKGK